MTDPTPTDMLAMYSLNAYSRTISDLTGIEYATHLQSLFLYNNQISNLSPLSGLINLRTLYLGTNQISDLSPLSGLTNLDDLDLKGNGLSDISMLSGCTSLIWLNLVNNSISDISPLAGLIRLKYLRLDSNQISNLTPLASLTNLLSLRLYKNQITNVCSLLTLTDLQELYLDKNQISDISPLADLTNLDYLCLEGNPLNCEACSVYIPQIRANNPGISIYYDACPPCQSTLMIDSSSGGSVTNPGEGAFSYAPETVVTIVASPSTGYHFVNWTGTAVDAGKVVNPSSASTTVTMTASYTLHANFAINTYTLTINATNGSVTATPNKSTYNHGETVSLQANANTGYHFTGWSGDLSGSTNPATLTMNGNKSVTANFAINTYTLTVSATNGTVTATPSKSAYDHGETVSLQATANTGYHFTGWSGDLGGSTNPATLTMNGNKTVTAGFAINTYTLTVNAANGSVTAMPSKSAYDHGEMVSLQANANTGYHFTGWSGDLSGSTNPATLTMNGNKTVTAGFGVNTYTLTLNATNGSVTTTPSKSTYNHGETVTLQAAANTGYNFTGWSGDLNGSTNPATLTMNGNKTVTADFAIDQVARTLIITSTPGGSVLSPGEGTFQYNQGDQVTLQAKADPLFKFVGWRGGISTNVNPYPFTMNADYTIKAHFESVLDVLYVDDNAPGDPGPGDPNDSDPDENGTTQHPFDSIQKAIDVAKEGARVIVRPGTYLETIDLQGKRIEVSGLNPDDPNNPNWAVIDGQGKDTVVRCNQREDPNCILTGFVITGGRGRLAGAILCVGSSPSIMNCLIVGNRTTALDGGGGGGVYCQDSNALFANCTISGNYGGTKGAGLWFKDSKAVVTNSVVWGNTPVEVLTVGSIQPVIVYTDVAGSWLGVGNLNAEPLFAKSGYWANPKDLTKVMSPSDPTAVWVLGDYHVKSKAGRWDPVTNAWIKDAVTSPCIDAGNPLSPVGAELQPNGNRINMGAYGGTRQASLSVSP